MGRASLGENARSVVASVRLTPAEAASLKAKFGSVNAALRAGVDATLHRKATTSSDPLADILSIEERTR